MSKASLYKISNPNRVPKPKEYDPEKERSDADRRFSEVQQDFDDFEAGSRRNERELNRRVGGN